MAVIDATDLIIGRLAAVAAKRALLGEEIKIVNCERAVMTGNKRDIFNKYKDRRERGGPMKGPYFPRRADALMRRTIRGMLPYKQAKGKFAFKKITCFVGVPAELGKEKRETIKEANLLKLKTMKFVRIADLCIYMGGEI